MRLLHISDFHLQTPVGYNVENLLSRLFDFIVVNNNEVRINHIIITGDLRNVKDSAKCDEIFEIIRSISKAADITTRNQVHIVPGNHDLKRSAEDEETLSKIRDNYDYERAIFANPSSCLPFMLNRFDEFFYSFCEMFYGDSYSPWNNRNENPHALLIDNKNAFIYLNSCLTCINSKRDGDLVVGLFYLQQHIKSLTDVENIFVLSHHPIQNLTNREETALEQLIKSTADKKCYWLCGDVHNNRAGSKDYIKLYQVGSITGSSGTIPDFAIYDINDETNDIERRVFRYLPHLNSTSLNPGGWKRVYIDPISPSL